MGTRELVFDIFAIDRASKVFTKVGAEAEGFGSKTMKAMNVVGAATATAIAAVGVMSVKNAMAMQESDAKIQGNAQITAAAAKGIGDTFLSTAGKSTFSGKAMADAFGPVAGVIQELSGHTLTAADSMTVMNAATTLSEATGVDLNTTTSSLAAVMQNYGLKVADAAEASNTLFNASRLTNIPLDTLVATVDKLHGKLGIASPSLSDTSSLLVDLANHGISGSKGVMVVNGALTSLLGGSKKTTGELKTLGVNVFNSSGKFVGMKDVLTQLTPKLAGMNDKQRLAAESALFGAGAAKAMNSTVLAGVAGLGKASAAVDKHNAAEDAARAKSATLEGQIKKLRAGFSDITTELGEKMIPVILKTVGWFTKHQTIAGALAGVIGGVLVAATVAWTVSLIANGVAIIAATWPILLIIAAIAALAVGLVYCWTHFQKFRDIVKQVFATIKVVVLQVVLGVVSLFGVWMNVWMTVVGAMINGAARAFGWMPGIGPKLRAAAATFNTFKDSANASLNKVKNSLSIQIQTAQAESAVANMNARIHAMNWNMPITMTGGHLAAQGPGGSGGQVAGHASGAQSFMGGVTTVGEQGPERVFLPGNTRILTAPQTARANGNGGGGGDIIINISGALDPVAVGAQIHKILKQRMRTMGTGLALG